MTKTAKKFIGLWIAVDDRDRIIAFDKNKETVYKKAVDFTDWDKDCRFRIYELLNPYDKQMIKCLLDYGW